MLALDYIDASIPFLKETDPIEKGLDWMDEYKLQYLPVVDSNSRKFLGVVSEELLLNQVVSSSLIKDVRYLECEVVLDQDEMILESFERLGELQFSIVPVIDKDEYVGLVTIQTLLNALLGFTVSSGQACSFLILRMSLLDYSLNSIARVVELNGEKVLNSFVRDVVNIPGKIDVVLKINTNDLSRLIAEFKQLDYSIVYSKSLHETEDYSKNNYLNLIKYLDI